MAERIGRMTPERRAYLREAKRRQRSRAVSAGLCVICACSPARPERVTCADCTNARVEARRRARGSQNVA